MLSDEAKKKYIKSGGVQCPYCDSPDIEGKGLRYVSFTEDQAYEEVECNDCHKEWTDNYKLIGITER